MTPQLTPSFWLEAVAVPALAVTVVFGAAGALAPRLRSGQRQRLLWLASFAAAALFLAGFVVGADRWLRLADHAASPPETRFIVRGNLPVGEAAALAEEASLPPARHLQPESAATHEVLWPAWLWLVGMLLVLGRAACQRIAFGLVIRRQRGEAGAELRERVTALAALLGMRRRVRVRVVSGLLSPAALGCWRPTVLVPDNFESAHGANERDAMLAHELAHLAARDSLWHGAARALVAVLWWHPLAWWALQRLRAASEVAADEASLVIENGPSELAACLVALGSRLQEQRIGWLGMAGNGFRSDLGRRVERLLTLPAGGNSWRQPRGFVLGMMALAVVGASALLGLTAWALPAGGESRPTLLALARQGLVPTAALESNGGRSAATPTLSPGASDSGEDSWGSWNSPLQVARLDGPGASADEAGAATPAPTGPSQDQSGARGTRPSTAGAGDSIAATNLLTRSYKLNPQLMIRSLEKSGANLSTNGVTAASLRELFAAAGVDWGGTNALSVSGEGAGFKSPTGKALFFNLANGMMLVRAAQADLEVIETTLTILNTAPLQVTIEAKFVEITEDNAKALGFDWFLGTGSLDGQTVLSPGVAKPETTPTNALNGMRAAAPTPGMLPSAQSPAGGVFPGAVPNQAGTPNLAPQADVSSMQVLRGDQLNWPGRDIPGATNIQVNATLEGRVAGILDDAQYRTLLKALETRPGVDIMAAPRVTTLDGRPAQIQVVDIRTVVTGLDSTALKQGIEGGKGTTNAPPFQTTQIPVGPVLDVIPKVEADGRTINLTLIATLTEFLGYDDPGQLRLAGAKAAALPPLPRFRVRQATTNVRIADGQTVVLGGMIARDTERTKDKVPMPGDLPLVGGAFRSESQKEVRKNLLVFVTATLIDPAGNRIHPR